MPICYQKEPLQKLQDIKKSPRHWAGGLWIIVSDCGGLLKHHAEVAFALLATQADGVDTLGQVAKIHGDLNNAILLGYGLVHEDLAYAVHHLNRTFEGFCAGDANDDLTV